MQEKFISISILMLLILAGKSFAQSDLLSRVPELQKTAQKAISGRLGCGAGSITLVTSSGEIKVGVDLDPIHVFGGRIVVKDLLTLLEARAESNRTGKTNPMSGEIGPLAYVILSTLAVSKDATVIPVIAELLDDKNEVVRRSAASALFSLAESGEALLNQVKDIEFPKVLFQSAKGIDGKLPVWIKLKEEN